MTDKQTTDAVNFYKNPLRGHRAVRRGRAVGFYKKGLLFWFITEGCPAERANSNPVPTLTHSWEQFENVRVKDRKRTASGSVRIKVTHPWTDAKVQAQVHS